MKKLFSTKKLFAFLLVAAVIGLLIFLNSRRWLEWPKSLVYRGASPFLRVFYLADNKISGSFHVFFTLKDLVKENNRLAAENKNLWQENSQAKEISRENELLRRRLGLALSANQKLIMADVVGFDAQSGQALLVNKGTEESVFVNAPAVDANNFLIGKVSEVSEHFAKITLLADSNSTINVLTQDSREDGLVKGSHGLGLMLEMIPADAKINSGETVLTSGLNDSTPGGLIIGRIGQIEKKENEIFQKAQIEPAVNPRELEKIFIIVK